MEGGMPHFCSRLGQNNIADNIKYFVRKRAHLLQMLFEKLETRHRGKYF